MNHTQSGGTPGELWLTPAVYTLLQETIGTRKAESGGMLGGCRETGEVTAFYFDETPREQSAAAYSPNHTLLTRVLKEEWKPRGIQLLGFVHSHPPHYTHPSPWDKEYAQTILDSMGLPYLLLPIIKTVADAGAFTLFPYLAKRADDGIEVVKQVLRVGDAIIPVEKPPENAGAAFPWELLADLGLAAIDVAALLAAGVTTAQLVKNFRRAQKEGGHRD